MVKINYNQGEQVGEAIFLFEVDKHIKRRARFRCKCGKTFVSHIHKVKRGEIKGCGCGRGKSPSSRNRYEHGGRSHPLYSIWCAMKARCYNKKHEAYRNYGGRGVIVCNEWVHDYGSFEKWALSNGWEPGLQIDKDLIGDGFLYSPDTCSFVTPKINSTARRNSKKISHNGIVKTASEWADEIGCTITLLHARLKRGWLFDRCYSMKKQ